ncbi:MAG: 2-hydroxyglutaryl-CoA dehydratase, partial [Myxococcota bacterium]
TAGSCGPCRFGTYVTEYRKALRDAGFEGFRVMLFQQQGGLKQATGDAAGLEMNPKFFIAIVKAIMAGDVLNAIGYRIRPYEVEKGATDEALNACQQLLHTALRERKSILWAILKSRKILEKVEINRLQPKPKVSIIGEFWAMTTEGDGNYKLQRFLESEGAEVEIQLVTNWLLYNLWEVRSDTKRRMMLRGADADSKGLADKDPRKRLLMLAVAESVLRGIFFLFSRAIGLQNYHLPDMNEIATISHQYYDNHLRGGEGHMEVGKLILTATKKKAHMVLSVKPFGCMPSSGVSDGVQSLISSKYPEAIFSAIETTGDGAVNAQSRVQMDMFKARQAAVNEYEEQLQKSGLSPEEADRRFKRKRRRTLYYPDHKIGIAGTGATCLSELA